MSLPDSIACAAKIARDMDELNTLLAQVGVIAQRLTNQGYDVHMTLWRADAYGDTVNGRLQANCAKATLRERPA